MNDKITKCLDCGKDVSVSADKCPHCGSQGFSVAKKEANGWGVIIGLGFFAWITWVFWGNDIRLWMKIHLG